MEATARYLSIIQPDGSLIPRADLYLLARMGAEDTENGDMVQQIYETMFRSDNTVDVLNRFEANIEKNHISHGVRLRVHAGTVLLTLVRIAKTTLKPPSVAKAEELCGEVAQQRSQRRASVENYVREARRGFMAYRNTAHLQAAALLPGTGVEDFENCETTTLQFLARARGLEQFIDNNVSGGKFKWSPWRVPDCIQPEFNINLTHLSAEEKSLIGLN